MKKTLLLLLSSAAACVAIAQEAKWNTPGAGNPFIPGYFADPTIRKFGDTFYLYATTDGTGNGYGPAQVWTSKDFRSWTNQTMNWPVTEVVWAPDVMLGKDGKYHYFYCEPCVLHEGVGDTPVGPWRNILGDENAVLVPDRFVHNAITLDGQTFVDDDGKVYLYFGTWGIYDGFGCGVARLNEDMKTFAEKKLIPNTEIKDFFEAPFVLKKDGVYYFMYSSGSCHDHTYRVQYATSTTGPMGPYEYKGCILETNDDQTVHGPGHHSVFKDGDDYYIVYHRHNNPKAIHGFHRQVCIDRLVFGPGNTIEKVVPTHEGVLPRSVQKMKVQENLAYGAKVTASSYYDEWYLPQYATDDNNATLWKPATCNGEDYIIFDLGKETAFEEIQTQFEYSTYYYQYRIETSCDGQAWTLFADKTRNTIATSPCVDRLKTRARYVRITVTGREMNGHFGGIWNVKVYAKPSAAAAGITDEQKQWAGEWKQRHGEWKRDEGAGTLLVDINADDYRAGELTTAITNRKGGMFKGANGVMVELSQGKQAFAFNGSQVLRSDFGLPETFCYSHPYTVSAWILNPTVENNECVAQLMPVRNDLSTIELCNGSDPRNGLMMHNASFENSGAPQIVSQAGQWQHWVVTYDGYMERHYLNGRQVSEKNMMLLLRPQPWMQLGASFDGNHAFSGYLHSLRLYSRQLSAAEVEEEYAAPSATAVCLQVRAADTPSLWVNPGTWGGKGKAQTGICAGKMALTAPLAIEGIREAARPQSLSITFCRQKGAKTELLLKTLGTEIATTKKGLMFNGTLIPAALRKEWNQLDVSFGTTVEAWLNGERLSLPADFKGLPTDIRTMTVGSERVAIASLLISSLSLTQADAVRMTQEQTSTNARLASFKLTVTPLTPRTARLSLTEAQGGVVADAQNMYRFQQNEWTRTSSDLVSLSSEGKHTFVAMVKDGRGNAAEVKPVSMKITEKDFVTITDNFSATTLDSGWKRLSGVKTTAEVSVSDGQLTLTSKDGNFNAHAADNAVMLYREVTGDFVVQGRLTGMTGSDRHQTPAYNEGGLMVLFDAQADNQQIVQCGVFPNYNCGNMLTTISHHGRRPQFPKGNGWNYEPWLQIERCGQLFHVRTSADGQTWTEMTGSPVEMSGMDAAQPVKVGFFQVTYTDKQASVSFDDFSLWQR